MKRLIAISIGLWLSILGLPLDTVAQSKPVQTIRIGVLAFRGAEHSLRAWSPTANYLSDKIANAEFEVIPLPLSDLEQATSEKRLDYVFTNSGQYVVLEEKYGISRIATLKKPFGNGIRNVFGAVIFTKAGRGDIQSLEDLRGKTFAAVREKAFGGFQMAWREFKSNNIDPFRDFAELQFLGLPQDNIVFAVRDGKADAGTVRTDVLETMAGEGAIDLVNFRILNRQEIAEHTVALSTRLYPEWPFAKMPHTPDELSEKVAIALLSMKADSLEMRTAGYFGWTVPLDYQPVHDLFKDLEIGLYAKGKIDFRALLILHWEWVVFALIVLLMITLHGIRTEYLVQRRTRELEHEIQERKIAEDRARQHEAELAHVSRVSVIGEMTSGLAHELRQPLAAIRNYAEGGIRRLERNSGDVSDMKDALSHINEQAGRAGQIISRVKGYLQKSEPRREELDINHAVQESTKFFKPDALRNQVTVRLDLTPSLKPIIGDLIEIEQLIINLARNAIEAMAPVSGLRKIHIRTIEIPEGVAVEVIDNGPGFDPDFSNEIWQPFATTKEGGLGLGLAICRSIVESHGGNIQADQHEDGGARVRLELPAHGGRGD